MYGEHGNAPRVLCLGDSVLERVAREDVDRRSLTAMLEHELPSAVISHSAYHPRIYKKLVAALQRQPRLPSVLVLPINIRCFSPQWDFHPEFQFEQELAALDRYIASPSDDAAEVTVDFWPSAEDREAYARRSVDYPGSSYRTIGDFIAIRDQPRAKQSPRRLAAIFEFHYMHPLASDHGKLRDLTELGSCLAGTEMRTLFYVTPLNVEAGVRHCGPAFDERIQSNVEVTREALRPFVGEHSRFVDYSHLVPSSGFVERDIANDHLNCEGRVRLAAEIVTHVRALLA